MCGRFNVKLTPAELAALFDAFDKIQTEIRRYNVAPSQQIPVVRIEDGKRVLTELRWGLVPSWQKEPDKAQGWINARGETVLEKPSFRSAFKQHRCLIPATGFYEWQQTGGVKQPYNFHLTGSVVFAVAGIWDRNEKGGTAIESCAILTTAANELVSQYHDRMPVILPPELYSVWLDSEAGPAELQKLLVPYSGTGMGCFAVSRKVGNPRFDSAECLEVAG